MKKVVQILMLVIVPFACIDDKKPTALEEYPGYSGEDLGLSREGESWVFRVWSPVADKMMLRFYSERIGGNPVSEVEMKEEDGVWKAVHPLESKGLFYTFQAIIDGVEMDEVVDPYVKLVGVNGKRGYLALPEDADPADWSEDRSPELSGKSDIILYEVHVRDFSIDAGSGMEAKGKFMAFTEEGTTSSEGVSTGLDHMVDLGVTHVHLLPSFDYRSIDETRLAEKKYNWGYDPQNYNVPEGGYATDPYDPLARVREFKQLVQALHNKGLRVVMDVVYNHTGYTESSLFNQLVPDYYYRQNAEGGFSDAAACGNEVASERSMVRKFILESVRFWAEEYHIDGFRFDLMGIHDIETMNLISQELRGIDPDIFIYGEGWTAGTSPLPDSTRALKANTQQLEGIAAFSDDLRDGIKGSVFEDLERGFVSGLDGTKESIKFGIVASTEHPDLDYDAVNYSDKPWASQPTQCINYVSCHDNMTLWDKLRISMPESSENDLVAMHKLANTIVLTSQGVPFLHAGVEFLRSKNGAHNSFESPDSINSIKWDRKHQYLNVYEYYRNLISLRKAHPAFRMTTTDQIRQHLEFMNIDDPLVVGYWLQDNANSDDWETIGVLINGSEVSKSISIPEGDWTAELMDGAFGARRISAGLISVAPKSALIFHN